MTRPVYLTRASIYLPNAPVGNEQMEGLLGQIGGRASRARAIVLRSNGIKQRHYAIDAGTGKVSHNNAQLTAEAVRALAGEGFELKDIEVLACGTSSPDYIIPNHAVMVHGELGNPPCEVVATSGVCVSGMTSLKYGFMSVKAGLSSNAVVTGSEIASSYLRAWNFDGESEARVAALEKKPAVAFEKDFLRWMLSDGAGALLLQDQPNSRGLSLRVEWVDQFSFANELPACMYAGAEKGEDGRLIGWRELGSMQEVVSRSVMALKQDVRLLEDGIRTSSRKGFLAMLARRKLAVADVDWLLPHYSSEYFRPVMYEVMPEDWKIPYERWFTNLAYKGNVGSASVYLMLEELLASGNLREGQKIL
ncbi:MAG TPA: beta-ketoacyl-ACP synthase III, partial [Solimonas sp.]|nr:beta-ketoacyl-ACP synthase III [Solimonas sp.]